jgi:hypothetical protein
MQPATQQTTMARPDDQQVTVARCDLNQGCTDVASQDLRSHVDVGGVAAERLVESIGKPQVGLLSPRLQQLWTRRSVIGKFAPNG